MKKIAKILLIGMLLLLTATAAAEVRSNVYFDSQRKTVNVVVSGLVAGNDYFLVITQPGTSLDQVWEQQVYMCIVTASDAGTVNYDIAHSALKKNMQVVMGGVFEDGISPRLLGTMSKQVSTLPSKLKTIEKEAFMGTDITSLRIGSRVTQIGDRAFKDCKALRTVYIENDSVKFGRDVFAGCTDLVIVCNAGSTAAAYAQSCSNVTCRYK